MCVKLSPINRGVLNRAVAWGWANVSTLKAHGLSERALRHVDSVVQGATALTSELATDTFRVLHLAAASASLSSEETTDVFAKLTFASSSDSLMKAAGRFAPTRRLLFEYEERIRASIDSVVEHILKKNPDDISSDERAFLVEHADSGDQNPKLMVRHLKGVLTDRSLDWSLREGAAERLRMHHEYAEYVEEEGIVDLLDSRDPEVRYEAVKILGEHADYYLGDMLTSSLEEGDDDVLDAVIDVLLKYYLISEEYAAVAKTSRINRLKSLKPEIGYETSYEEALEDALACDPGHEWLVHDDDDDSEWEGSPEFGLKTYFYPEGDSIEYWRQFFRHLEDNQRCGEGLVSLNDLIPIHSLADYQPDENLRWPIMGEYYDRLVSCVEGLESDEVENNKEWIIGEAMSGNRYPAALELSSGEMLIVQGHHRLAAFVKAVRDGVIPQDWLEGFPMSIVHYTGFFDDDEIKEWATYGVNLTWNEMFPLHDLNLAWFL